MNDNESTLWADIGADQGLVSGSSSSTTTSLPQKLFSRLPKFTRRPTSSVTSSQSSGADYSTLPNADVELELPLRGGDVSVIADPVPSMYTLEGNVTNESWEVVENLDEFFTR
jgi:hypothetical protein